MFLSIVPLPSTLACCPRSHFFDIVVSQDSTVHLPTCQHSSSLSRPLPSLSLSANSPHVLHQTERSPSHAYGHVQTSATINIPTSTITDILKHCSQIHCPLGDWYIYFNTHGDWQKSHQTLLPLISVESTQSKFHFQNTSWPLLLTMVLISLLEVRITWLSTLFLLLPASCLALRIANRSASITECSNFLSAYCFYFETTFDTTIENSLSWQWPTSFLSAGEAKGVCNYLPNGYCPLFTL